MDAYQWKAIQLNDTNYDGIFFYALKSTGTFCRPSCSSRLPNPKNVQIFYEAENAIEQGYRACKRCKPDYIDWKGTRADLESQVKNYILQHFNEKLTLNRISKALSFDPYHLHRTFKLVSGSTPLQFLHQTRTDEAKKLLLTTSLSATEIGFLVGYTSLSHFSKVFKDKFQQSPSCFRKKHSNLSSDIPI